MLVMLLSILKPREEFSYNKLLEAKKAKIPKYSLIDALEAKKAKIPKY